MHRKILNHPTKRPPSIIFRYVWFDVVNALVFFCKIDVVRNLDGIIRVVILLNTVSLAKDQTDIFEFWLSDLHISIIIQHGGRLQEAEYALDSVILDMNASTERDLRLKAIALLALRECYSDMGNTKASDHISQVVKRFGESLYQQLKRTSSVGICGKQ